MTAVRLVLWNMLHLPASLCVVLCFGAGLLLPLPICLLAVRRVPLLRKLFLGS